MKGSIYLIGGGEIAHNETQFVDKEIKRSAPKNTYLVFVGRAAQDNKRYQKAVENVFGDHFIVRLATKELGRKQVAEVLKEASVIYIGGGETRLLLEYFEEWGLAELLIEANNKGTVIAGMSAGAQALSSWYVHEFNDGNMEIQQGWGLVDCCVLVHATPNSFECGYTIWKKHEQARKYPLVGISEAAAWHINTSSDRKRLGNGSILIHDGVNDGVRS